MCRHVRGVGGTLGPRGRLGCRLVVSVSVLVNGQELVGSLMSQQLRARISESFRHCWSPKKNKREGGRRKGRKGERKENTRRVVRKQRAL